MKKFALIGAAGYIAPRHFKAIKETGNSLVGAFDPSDSVGIVDQFFPDAHFFTEFERFDRYLHKLARDPEMKVDFVSICSPNYLHDAHARFALRAGADAIVEKPLVLNPWNIDALVELEQETGRRIHTILQLRLHPAIMALKAQVEAEPDKTFDVDLTYITARGRWYMASWKGDAKKSGGIATNIGVHFFDMLHYVFGSLRNSVVHERDDARAAGYLEYDRARVRWFLSIDAQDLPEAQAKMGQRTYRSITMDGGEIEFSDGFTDLHNRSYQEVLAGRGFSLEENRSAIETVAGIRTAPVQAQVGERHPFVGGRSRPQ
jgi:UDP-N-acetyl-2-amino-2-deoxyglucuronate dehydrogenase